MTHYDFSWQNFPRGNPPASTSKSVEVIFPITPKKAIMLNNAGLTGHQEIDAWMVDEINTRTFQSAKMFLASGSQITKEYMLSIKNRWRRSLILYKIDRRHLNNFAAALGF